jgi:glyoxylase-like metal-dependent hydrolase (beta-lactamase superfamily II)
MKMYAFSCGTLTCDKSLITFGRDIGKKFTVPVPYYLIQHPKGNVLFDLGNSIEVARDAKKHWGVIADFYVPEMKEDDYVVNNLKKIGIKPEDIKYIVMSHLHLDHAGGVGEFPNAKYIVQKEDLRWAYTCDFYQKLAYIRADFDKPVQWLILDGHNDDRLDLFGDGKLIIWFTPGHTPGGQSLVVKLNEGTVVLTGDAVYTMEILNENVLPGLGWDQEVVVKTIQRMRMAEELCGYKIFTGHDPDVWATLKKAPKYYE